MYQTPLLSRVTWFSCKAWVSNLWDGNENTFPPKTTEGSRWYMQQAWSQGAECKPSLSCYGLLSINPLISHCCKLPLLPRLGLQPLQMLYLAYSSLLEVQPSPSFTTSLSGDPHFTVLHLYPHNGICLDAHPSCKLSLNSASPKMSSEPRL